jgi:hypothetical protein
VDGGQMGSSRPWGEMELRRDCCWEEDEQGTGKKSGRWELLPRERVGAGASSRRSWPGRFLAGQGRAGGAMNGEELSSQGGLAATEVAGAPWEVECRAAAGPA